MLIEKINNGGSAKLYIHCTNKTSFVGEIHYPPKVKVQHVLMFSCFAHYSWINEHKDMKLR